MSKPSDIGHGHYVSVASLVVLFDKQVERVNMVPY